MNATMMSQILFGGDDFVYMQHCMYGSAAVVAVYMRAQPAPWFPESAKHVHFHYGCLQNEDQRLESQLILDLLKLQGKETC